MLKASLAYLLMFSSWVHATNDRTIGLEERAEAVQAMLENLTRNKRNIISIVLSSNGLEPVVEIQSPSVDYELELENGRIQGVLVRRAPLRGLAAGQMSNVDWVRGLDVKQAVARATLGLKIMSYGLHAEESKPVIDIWVFDETVRDQVLNIYPGGTRVRGVPIRVVTHDPAKVVEAFTEPTKAQRGCIRGLIDRWTGK